MLRPPPPKFPKSTRAHRSLPSLIPGYSGPETWRACRSHGTFYAEHVYLSDRGRVLNYHKGEWRVVRPRTIKRKLNYGVPLYPIIGPDTRERLHYLSTLATGSFTRAVNNETKRCYRTAAPL